MSTRAATPLAEQRHALREQLGTQRVQLARDLATGGAGEDGYPRSITVRWLIREPELVKKLATRLVGSRMAAAAPVILTLARFLHSAIVVRRVRPRTDQAGGRAYVEGRPRPEACAP